MSQAQKLNRDVDVLSNAGGSAARNVLSGAFRLCCLDLLLFLCLFCLFWLCGRVHARCAAYALNIHVHKLLG